MNYKAGRIRLTFGHVSIAGARMACSLNWYFERSQQECPLNVSCVTTVFFFRFFFFFFQERLKVYIRFGSIASIVELDGVHA